MVLSSLVKFAGVAIDQLITSRKLMSATTTFPYRFDIHGNVTCTLNRKKYLSKVLWSLNSISVHYSVSVVTLGIA